MKTELAKFLDAHDISMAKAARMIGYSYAIVHRHCTGKSQISVKAAMLYEKKLGIPRSTLRPDVWQ